MSLLYWIVAAIFVLAIISFVIESFVTPWIEQRRKNKVVPKLKGTLHITRARSLTSVFMHALALRAHAPTPAYSRMNPHTLNIRCTDAETYEQTRKTLVEAKQEVLSQIAEEKQKFKEGVLPFSLLFLLSSPSLSVLFLCTIIMSGLSFYLPPSLPRSFLSPPLTITFPFSLSSPSCTFFFQNNNWSV